MPDGGSGGGQLVRVAAVAGAGFAAYEFLYKPWAIRRALEEATRAKVLANLNKGMGIEDAASDAVATACAGAATVYKVPPALSGPLCKGVGLIAVKGAIVAAKEIGKGVKLAGKGAKVVAKGVGKGAKAVGSVAKKLSHGFGLWGLGDFEDPGGNPFAAHHQARSSGVDRTIQPRARRGVRTKQEPTGAAFYTRHL